VSKRESVVPPVLYLFTFARIQSMTPKKHFTIILILGSLTALGPFSIDMYLPGFTAIANDLHTTTAQVALSLSSFFIGISAGQLLYGPLLDRYGRKKPLYFGLTVYLLASLGCAMMHTVDGLIMLRFIQAIGSCAAGVASVAMVRDFFPPKDGAKIFSMLILILGTSPMLAPTVGSYVTAAFGWQSVFIILAVISALILLAVIFLLPEGKQPDPSYSLKPSPIIKTFLSVLKVPKFLTYTIMGAVTLSGLLVYVAGSPTVFMEIFKVTGKQYGWIFAALSVGFVGASQVNRIMLKRFKSEQLIRGALMFQTIIAILLLTGSINNWLGLAGTITLIFLFLGCVGFILPNASALSMEPFSKDAGSASALMGALQMGVSSVFTLVLSNINNGTAVPMTSIMMGSAIIALLVFSVGQRLIPVSTESAPKPEEVFLH
jgi:DHA1 family bicyclomycin/chloramphenicol resistance-like MFS transporter